MKTTRSQHTFQDIELGHASLRDASQPRSTDATPATGDTIALQPTAGRFKKHLVSAAAIGGTLLGGGLVAAVTVPVLKQQRHQALVERDAALARLAAPQRHFAISATPPPPSPVVSGDDTSAHVVVGMNGATQTLKQGLFYKSGEGIDLILSNHPDLCEIMTDGAAMSDFASGLTLHTTLYNVAPFGAGYGWDETLLPLQDGIYSNAVNIVTSGKWTLGSVLTDGLNRAVVSRLGLQANVTAAFANEPGGIINGTLAASSNDGTGSVAIGSFQARRCVSIEDSLADSDAYEQVNEVAEALAQESQRPSMAPSAEDIFG